MDNKSPIIDPDSGQESLEGSPTVVEQVTNSPTSGEPIVDADNPTPTPPPIQKKWWNRIFSHLNIYLLMFLLVLVIGVTIVAVAYLNSKHGSGTTAVTSQSLSQSTFEQLANTSATVGNSNQVLTVQSNAIFAGKVLARQGLEIAGNLQVGGTLAINDLAVAGGTSLQGAVTIAKSLEVGGSASFGGSLSALQIATSSLQLNGDLALTHHLTTGGAVPSRTSGNALGGGGTSSVSGSDTAGSITINTGSGPSAGCFITVNFTSKYSSTPHVVVTPVGISSGGLSYYVDRSAGSFSVCDATTPPANTSFGFDYLVFD